MTKHESLGRSELQLYLLVMRCQAGDERAFARLMEVFGPRSLAYLRGIIGDDAEDVQQEVWLSVYRSAHTLSNPRAFRTWLFRTTRHRAIDFLRSRRRERELIDDSAERSDAVADEETDVAFDDLDVEALQVAMSALPPAQREVLQLRYLDDMSYGDIAAVVGCSVGTIRSRLHYAKQRVQELLTRGMS